MLYRDLETSGLEDLRDIQVEEIAVQDGLDASSNNSNEIEESSIVVSVDPVEDVQCTVGTQRKQVMRCDGFSFAGFWYHEELRKDGDGFQVDGEGPQHLHHRHAVVDQHRQPGDWDDDEFDAECVVIGVVGSTEFDENKVAGTDGCDDEDAFHDSVVERDESRGQVQVSGQEDQCEQGLRFTGYTGARMRFPYLDQKQEDGEKMGKIPSKSDDIHGEAFFNQQQQQQLYRSSS